MDQIMEVLKSFLESSTIHGLNYISTTRKVIRLLWILTVIAGFTGAGVIIYQSFDDWNQNPITTTVETRPIREITFPKITVCPPKNTFTDLNYDIIMMKNKTLDNETRAEMTNYAMELLYDDLYENMMANLSKLQDSKRYYNWYHGYTEINLPVYEKKHGLRYFVITSATSGNISTQNFGEMFDPEKVDTHVEYHIEIHGPMRKDLLWLDRKLKLHFYI